LVVVPVEESPMSSLVAKVVAKVATRIDTTKKAEKDVKSKNRNDAEEAAES
jgi:hypothetical protein